MFECNISDRKNYQVFIKLVIEKRFLFNERKIRLEIT